MRLAHVSIIEGVPVGQGGAVGSYDLLVERTGWTLVDSLRPGVETHWSWDDISGLTAITGVHTAEGLPATSLDLIVNGWPVRLVVPSDQLPHPGPVLLTMLAPAGHVLRGAEVITQAAPTRRLDEVVRLRRSPQRRPVPLRTVGATGVGAAAAVAVMVAGTVIAAAVLSSGGAPPSNPDRTPPKRSALAPVVRQPATPAPNVTPTTGGPSVAAAGGAGADTVPLPLPTTTATSSTKPSTKSSTTSTTKPVTHKPSTGSAGSSLFTSAASGTSASTGTVAGPTPTTTRAPTTTTPATTTSRPAPTTTTTRPRRQPTTTTQPPRSTTTTRPARHGPPTTVPPTTVPPTTVPPTTTPPTTTPPTTVPPTTVP